MQNAQDDVDLNRIVDRLYEVILFDGEEAEPDWGRVEQLFSTGACISCVTPFGTDFLDVATFKAMARELVALGKQKEFFECEIARRVDRIGQMAHVWSVYEIKIHPDATESVGRGVTSIQLIHEDGQWRVASLSWDDDALGRCGARSTPSPGRKRDGAAADARRDDHRTNISKKDGGTKKDTKGDSDDVSLTLRYH